MVTTWAAGKEEAVGKMVSLQGRKSERNCATRQRARQPPILKKKAPASAEAFGVPPDCAQASSACMRMRCAACATDRPDVWITK
jgi:hypothetical protein